VQISSVSATNNSTYGRLKPVIKPEDFSPRFIKTLNSKKDIHLLPPKPIWLKKLYAFIGDKLELKYYNQNRRWLTEIYKKFGFDTGLLPAHFEKAPRFKYTK